MMSMPLRVLRSGMVEFSHGTRKAKSQPRDGGGGSGGGDGAHAGFRAFFVVV